MSMGKTRAFLETMTEFELANFKMKIAAIAFADPELILDPDVKPDFDPDNNEEDAKVIRPEDWEFYDAATETYLEMLDLVDQEMEKRIVAKAAL